MCVSYTWQIILQVCSRHVLCMADDEKKRSPVKATTVEIMHTRVTVDELTCEQMMLKICASKFGIQ